MDQVTAPTDHSLKPAPPPWHPEEIRFLLSNRVLAGEADIGRAARIKTRWIHQTLREVFITPSGFVLKRFSDFPGRKDYRRAWRREHRALMRLEGLNVPRSLKYVSVRHAHGPRTVLYVRHALPGEQLTAIGADGARSALVLLAAFHDRGVVTLDPRPENFIALEGTQELGFVDFGRARTFRWQTPYALLHVGKDLTRFRLFFNLDPALFRDLLEVYRDHRTERPGAFGWLIVKGSLNFWSWRLESIKARESAAPRT